MVRYVFWISLIFIIYTYLLYPVIILILSKLKRKKVSMNNGQHNLPSITTIIVVYNEENQILEKLQNCRELDYPKDLLSVCFVSDGSTDRTNEILREQDDILFIEDSVNHGKPSQINKAVHFSESEIIVFSDVRQMYNRDALRKLVRNFNDPNVGAVSGELTFQTPQNHTGKSIGLYWRYEKIIRKAESAINSTMGVTGAIYAIRREHFSSIPDDTILDDIEIPLNAFKKGYRVIFEPEAIAYDIATSEIKTEFSRKVRTLAGNFQLFRRNNWLLDPIKNRIFFQTISHKLFRLFIPYALIFLLLTTSMIDVTIIKIFFWIQIILYSLGISATFISDLRKNRLINFISVFLTLNAASVAALYKFSMNEVDARWKK